MTPGVLRLSVVAAAVCIVVLLAAGCGSSSASLPAADAARLHKDVAGVRSAASAHDPAAARAAVRTLRADVARLRAAGMLAPADAGVLLSDAGQVNRRVLVEVHARTPASAPAAAPSPAPAAGTPPSSGPAESPPAAGHGKGHGKHGRGRGKGGDGGDGGD